SRVSDLRPAARPSPPLPYATLFRSGASRGPGPERGGGTVPPGNPAGGAPEPSGNPAAVRQRERRLRIGRGRDRPALLCDAVHRRDRKSTRLNSSHVKISYAVFCLKK